MQKEFNKEKNEKTIIPFTVIDYKGQKVFICSNEKKLFMFSRLNVDFFPKRNLHKVVGVNGDEYKICSNNTGGHADFSYWSGSDLPEKISNEIRSVDSSFEKQQLLFAEFFDVGDTIHIFWHVHQYFRWEFNDAMCAMSEDFCTKILFNLGEDKWEESYGPMIAIVASDRLRVSHRLCPELKDAALRP